ncbi:MAG: dynamin family protein, partial [Fusobacteriaceae bacterium]|nr:dynamin family protein [Fusobacteriaceae bacterium]
MSNEENDIKLKLMSAAINAEPINNIYVKEFENLIEKDFREFCNNELVVNSANAIDNLRYILYIMQNIASFPELHSKTLGAIGGGFSSGKSSFINSFITDSTIKLAEGIRPVTAIPSYVVAGNSQKVNGINDKGGIFDIDFKLYKSITHDFLKEFSFDLKKIIRYITVSCPMKENLFNNICLIDTPGYNPPNSDSEKHDFEIAKEYIKDAQFLIWTIGIDTNGTIPKSDLAFLNECGFGANKDSVQNKNRKLYIVINKADLKTQKEIEAILDEIVEILDDEDIIYEGICVYSSRIEKIYTFCKTNIIDFLLGQNIPSKKYWDITGKLYNIFKEYEIKINQDHFKRENMNKELDSLKKEIKTKELNDIENGKIDIETFSSQYEKIKDRVENFKKIHEPSKNLKERQEVVKNLYQKFLKCFNNFCDEMVIDRNSKDIPHNNFKETLKPQKRYNKVKIACIVIIFIFSYFAISRFSYKTEKEYYENGKIKSEIRVSNKNLKRKFKFYYENGKLEKKGIIINNFYEGLCISYYDNGKNKIEANYKNGELDGKYKEFYHNGNIKLVGFMLNNKLSGEYKEYNDKGKRIIEGNLIDGLKEGIYKTYYSNGKKEAELNFKNDKYEGLQKFYYENKKIRIHANYKNGELVGEYKEFYDDGNIKIQANYKNGELDGEYKEFDHSGNIKIARLMSKGQLVREGYDINGLKIGLQKFYYENGKIKIQANYKNDMLDGEYNDMLDGEYKEFYIDGNLKIQTNYKNDMLNGKYEEFYIDGNLKIQTNYKKGLKEGKSNTYYFNGNIETELNYKNGVLEGLQKFYYEDGKIKMQANYKNDMLDGKHEEFDIDGNLKIQANYKKGLKEGKSNIYYFNGNIETELNYKNGVLEGLQKFYYEDGKIK